MTETPPEEPIELPDGSELPAGYVPGDLESEPWEGTPPPDGQTWDEYVDWSD